MTVTRGVAAVVLFGVGVWVLRGSSAGLSNSAERIGETHVGGVDGSGILLVLLGLY